MKEDLQKIQNHTGYMAAMLLRMVSRRAEDRPALCEVIATWRATLGQGPTVV